MNKSINIHTVFVALYARDSVRIYDRYYNEMKI